MQRQYSTYTTGQKFGSFVKYEQNRFLRILSFSFKIVLMGLLLAALSQKYQKYIFMSIKEFDNWVFVYISNFKQLSIH